MDPIHKALRRWVDLMGEEPSEEFGGSYNTQITYKELKETQELDSTGITTAMLLNSFLENHMENSKFSVKDMVDNPQEYTLEIERVLALKEALQNRHIVEAVESFQDGLRETTEFYKFGSKDVKKLIGDQYNLAFIRRDALYAMNKLKEYQFMQGGEATDTAKFNPHVYEFWNVNSLLRLTLMQPEDGVSLCLIRDANALHSFFCFVIRNGHTVTVLTDRPEWSHPEQKYMTRRPDRELYRRAARYRFPYELLDLKWTPDGRRLYTKERIGLVPYQRKSVRLKSIKKLSSDTILWLVVIFAEIRDKYWIRKYQAEELAYTGEMVVQSDKLLESVSLPVVRASYRELELPEITTDDVTTDELLSQWEVEPTRKNEWLEKRYGSDVLKKDLNQVLLPVPKKEEGHFFLEEREKEYPLKAFGTTDFGTAEEMQRDRLWFARYNKAQRIQEAADKEYEERKEEVIGWFQSKVLNNVDNLMLAVAKGSFTTIGQTLNPKCDFDFSHENESDILKIYDDQSKEAKGPYSYSYLPLLGERYNGAVLHGGHFGKYDYTCYRCVKSRARMIVRFEPKTAQALADLAGVSKRELPDVLQEWMVNEPYYGNNILNRIDPLEWVVENPWRQENFNVIIMLCKRCLNVIQSRFKKGESIKVK